MKISKYIYRSVNVFMARYIFLINIIFEKDGLLDNSAAHPLKKYWSASRPFCGLHSCLWYPLPITDLFYKAIWVLVCCLIVDTNYLCISLYIAVLSRSTVCIKNNLDAVRVYLGIFKRQFSNLGYYVYRSISKLCVTFDW